MGEAKQQGDLKADAAAKAQAQAEENARQASEEMNKAYADLEAAKMEAERERQAEQAKYEEFCRQKEEEDQKREEERKQFNREREEHSQKTTDAEDALKNSGLGLKKGQRVKALCNLYYCSTGAWVCDEGCRGTYQMHFCDGPDDPEGKFDARGNVDWDTGNTGNTPYKLIEVL